MLKTLIRWTSGNGNYMIKLMGYTHDGATDYDIRVFKRNSNGKYVVHHGHSPKYVREKIFEMRRGINK